MRRVVLPVAGALALALPFIVTDRYTLHVFTHAFLFASLAVAWDIVGGTAGQLSLGHSTFFAIGSYTSVLLLIHKNITPLVSLFLAAGLAVVAAVVIGYPAFRLRGAFFAMTTIAFAEIFRVVLLHFKSLTGGADGLSVPFAGANPSRLQFAGEVPYYFLALATLTLSVLIHRALGRSRMGYGLRAIRDDQILAEALGIRSNVLKLGAFAVSAALTAVIGVLYAAYIGYIDPDSVASLPLSIKIAVMAIVGGRDSALGGVLGAFLVIGLEQLTNAWLGEHGGVSVALYGVLIMIVVLAAPRGLITLWEHSMAAGRRPAARGVAVGTGDM